MKHNSLRFGFSHVVLAPCPICDKEFKVRGGGLTHHIKWHERQGDLSKDCNTSTEGGIIRIGERDLEGLLKPLLTDGAVAIEVEGKRMYRKQRIVKQVLFITMGRLFGDPRAIVFGLAGGGCEIQKIDDLKLTPLIRVGLQGDMAKEIIGHLSKLLLVNNVNSESKNA